jgi:hypothetical protein
MNFNVQQFIQYIKSGQFGRGFQLIDDLKTFNQFHTVYFQINELAYEGNICSYGFACYLNFLYETKDSLDLISSILNFYMNYIEGGFRVTFARSMRLMEILPNNQCGYYGVFQSNFDPCCNLADDEVLEISQIMQRKWPDNEDAVNNVQWRTEYCEKNNIIPRLFVEKLTEKIIENKREAFKWLISQGRFAESRLLLADFFEDEIEEIIVEIATQLRMLCAYDFVWFWMHERCGESTKKHLLLARIARLIFCPTEGSLLVSDVNVKELCFFHIYRAAELSPDDIDIQEKLLSLYEVDNESFDVEETLQLAQRVLRLKPECIEAQRVLSLMK